MYELFQFVSQMTCLVAQIYKKFVSRLEIF